MIIPYVELNLHSRTYLRISYFGTIIGSNATMQRLAYASAKCAYD